MKKKGGGVIFAYICIYLPIFACNSEQENVKEVCIRQKVLGYRLYCEHMHFSIAVLQYTAWGTHMHPAEFVVVKGKG